MEELMGKTAKSYNYVKNVFLTMAEYYNYEYVKMPVVIKDDSKDLQVSDNLKNYYLKEIKKGFRKFYYEGNIYVDNKEDNKVGFLAIGESTNYQDAEIISMVYRLLEEIGFEEFFVRLKISKNYDINELERYLEYLDVDFEIVKDDLLNDEVYSLTLEFIINDNDREVVVGQGSKESASIDISCNMNELVKLFDCDNIIDNNMQIYIVGETLEERIIAMKIAQDLRWCEFRIDVDTINKTLKEQLEIANASNVNYIIIVDKEKLQKGLITVRDRYLNEDVDVDEAEIIDYIASNL